MIARLLPRCHGLEILLITALLLSSTILTTTLAVEPDQERDLPPWWECSAIVSGQAQKTPAWLRKTLIWLHRERGSAPHKGLIKTRAVTYLTTFHFDGIESRWDWTTDDGTPYAFLIDPTGKGRYHQLIAGFLGEPRHTYACHPEGTTR